MQENIEGFVFPRDILVEIDQGVAVAWLLRKQVQISKVLKRLILKLVFQLWSQKVVLFIVLNLTLFLFHPILTLLL